MIKIEEKYYCDRCGIQMRHHKSGSGSISVHYEREADVARGGFVHGEWDVLCKDCVKVVMEFFEK